MMEQTLAEFFRAYEVKPWKPGFVDCCLALASWSIWLGHSDPAEHLRGTYDTQDGFQAIVARAGGVVPLVADCAGKIGLKRVQRPLCGAVGVIGSPTNIQRQFGAIYDGEHWKVRFQNRINIMHGRTLAAWDI